MWIISKNGLFNLKATSYVYETPEGTFTLCGGQILNITEQKIQDRIIFALKNNLEFLEVE